MQALSAALMTSRRAGRPRGRPTGCRWWRRVRRPRRCVPPVTPGATTPGTETLAGASIASVGTRGAVGQRRRRSSASADAVPAPTPARLAVQAAESSASGTRAVAFCRRPNRVCGHRGLSLVQSTWPRSLSTRHRYQRCVSPAVTRSTVTVRDARVARSTPVDATSRVTRYAAIVPREWPGPHLARRARTSAVRRFGPLGDNGRVTARPTVHDARRPPRCSSAPARSRPAA